MSSVISNTGTGKVYLLAGGGKVYTDIAARFVRTEKSVEELIQADYNPQIVRNILESGHGAALEFDFFIFGVEGYSRVTETQLVRKRHASYLIKSGRAELNGKRTHKYCIPEPAREYTATVSIPHPQSDLKDLQFNLSGDQLADICSQWYDSGLKDGLKEEDLRYLKPQATEFKAIIGMNCTAIREWVRIRMCQNAQAEIRDLATKMLKLCKEVSPDLFEGAGASCVGLGYCPEGRLQNPKCVGKIPTHKQVLDAWKNQRSNTIRELSKCSGTCGCNI